MKKEYWKLATFMYAALFSFCLFACGDDENENNDKENNKEEEVNQPPANYVTTDGDEFEPIKLKGANGVEYYFVGPISCTNWYKAKELEKDGWYIPRSKGYTSACEDRNTKRVNLEDLWGVTVSDEIDYNEWEHRNPTGFRTLFHGGDEYWSGTTSELDASRAYYISMDETSAMLATTFKNQNSSASDFYVVLVYDDTVYENTYLTGSWTTYNYPPKKEETIYPWDKMFFGETKEFKFTSGLLCYWGVYDFNEYSGVLSLNYTGGSYDNKPLPAGSFDSPAGVKMTLNIKNYEAKTLIEVNYESPIGNVMYKRN